MSAAYYSLFHRLLDEIEQKPNWTSKGIPVPLRGILISADLNDVAESFVELKRLRHEADYDVTRSHSKRETLSSIGMCEGAHAAWDRCRKATEARAYLTMMVVDYEKLKDR